MIKYFLLTTILHLIPLLFIEKFLENKTQKFIKIDILTSKAKLVYINDNSKVSTNIKQIISDVKNTSQNIPSFSSSKVQNLMKNNPLEKKGKNIIKSKNSTSSTSETHSDFSKQDIDFKIIKEVKQNYPRKAKLIKYNKKVIIETKFLVDSSGKVKDIMFLISHENIGFNAEVIKALKKWKFEPIIHNNKKIEVYCYKKFIFEPNS